MTASQEASATHLSENTRQFQNNLLDELILYIFIYVLVSLFSFELMKFHQKLFHFLLSNF